MPMLSLTDDQPFSLDQTLTCGQVFRWHQVPDGGWRGIVGDRLIRIRQDGSRLTFSGAGKKFIKHYFSLDSDLPAIVASFDRDPFIHRSAEACHGLRLIRQPPWECLVSYICSTNSNIPMIRKRIEHIARAFGKPVEEKGITYFGFPKPPLLAGTCEDILTGCKMGYRGKYVKKTACDVGDTDDWAARIRSLPYEPARRELMKFSGVGPKAADCILLFAFQKYEAFPVDVWIRRIMRERYLPALVSNTPLSSNEYNAIRRFARDHFGEYCGYAQEYLYAAREEDL